MNVRTEKEWAEFGKKIFDTAVNHFKDKPIKEVVIPIEFLEYGEVLKVSVTDVRQFCMPTGPANDRYRSYKRGWPLSDGTIEWGEEE